MKPWKHFKTITHHRMLVMVYCFRVGLIWQGLVHDLSKYSPTEFSPAPDTIRVTAAPTLWNGNRTAAHRRGFITKAATGIILNTGMI